MKELFTSENNKQKNKFSALEVAQICGVSNQTVINWVQKGRLQAVKTPGGQYRIQTAVLVEFLNSLDHPALRNFKNFNFRGFTRSLLVVEDDPYILELYQARSKLAFPDLRVFTAQNAFEMGYILGLHFPKVVVLDLDLPGIRLQDIAKQIRGMSQFQRPALIGIGTIYDPHQSQELLQKGFEAVLVEDDEGLWDLVKKYL